jgi:hypothetical protein
MLVKLLLNTESSLSSQIIIEYFLVCILLMCVMLEIKALAVTQNKNFRLNMTKFCHLCFLTDYNNFHAGPENRTYPFRACKHHFYLAGHTSTGGRPDLTHSHNYDPSTIQHEAQK